MELAPLDRARSALKKHFGYDDFRPGQAEIITSVLEGRNTLAVLPTGGGKSVCYQVPAILSSGLTIVVSPLIALMKDQVDALQGSGIRATAIHSFIDFRDAITRLEHAREGRYSILYVAPERFESTAFLEKIRHTNISLFAVDEAHCISEWGHNFRPSYRRLKEAIRFLGSPTVLALTATATPDVRRDIVAQLELENPEIIVRGFNRPNLALRVAREVKKRPMILEMCMKGEPGIVYAGTRKTVEDLAEFLKSHAIPAAAYHAGLGDTARRDAQERFLSGDVQVVVATTAFGMGIDKPDVRFVIHYDMPSTIEQYYQEAGRAGRDGKPSSCLLLHTPSDVSLPEFFIQSSFPDRSLVQEVYNHLHDMAGTQEGQEYRGVLSATPSSIGAQIAVQNQSAIQGALRLLEESGYLRQINASYAESDVEFTVSAERMRAWLTEAADENVQPVAIALLRTAGGEAFHHPVRFMLSDLAEKAFLSEEYIMSGMRDMAKLGLLVYNMGQRSSGIALLGPRVGSRGLAVDFKKLDALKRHQHEKLQAVQQYINAGTCRRNMILDYFDEKTGGTCGTCDNCTAPDVSLRSGDRDDDRLRRLILECTAELGGKFGKTTIIDVLRGAKTKRVSLFRLYEADTYGNAERAPKSDLAAVIDGLLGLGWIAKTGSIHPTIYVTETGASKLRRGITPLNLPRFASGDEIEVRDPALYNTLRNIRRRIATSFNIPSHTLMNDTVLRAVANTAPETEPAFEQIEGVGPVTFKRCAKEMLKAILEHREKQLADQMKRSKPHEQKQLPASLQGTFRLCTQGMNLTEIAYELGLTEGTVSGHVAEIISLGYTIDTSHLVSATHRSQIARAMASLKTRELRKIKQVLDSDISYAEIRVILGESEGRKSR